MFGGFRIYATKTEEVIQFFEVEFIIQNYPENLGFKTEE